MGRRSSCSCCKDKEAPRKVGAWSKSEDELLLAHVKVHGKRCWHLVRQNTGLLRCGKSCGARWNHYLSPNIKRGDFSDEEIELISELHEVFGNKWSKIAKSLPGRTNQDIRSYWRKTHKEKQAAASGYYKAKTSADTVSGKEELTQEFRFENQTGLDGGKFADLNLDLTLSFPCQKKTPELPHAWG